MALTFEVGVNDRVSGPMKSAASSMVSAADKANILAGSLKAVDAAIIKAEATGAKASTIAKLANQQRGLAAALDEVSPKYAAQEAAAQKATAAAAAKKASDLAAIKTNGILRDSLAAAAQGAKEFVSAIAAGDAGAAIKGFGDMVAGAAKSLDLIAPGLGQAASAILSFTSAITGGIVGAFQKMAEKGIEVTESLRLMSGQLEALSDGAASGSEVLEVVDRIALKTGAARDKVAELARTFEGMGIRDLGNLETAMVAARSSTALVGESGAAAFVALTEKIQAATDAGAGLKIATRALDSIGKTGVETSEVAAKLGISVTTLAARLKAGTQNAAEFGDALQKALIDKGKGPLADLANSLGGLKARFSNSIDKLFEGVNAKPAMAEVGKLVDMFDQSTASGQAMKLIIGTAIDAIGEAVTRVVPILRKGLVLGLVAALEILDFFENHATALKVTLGALAVGAALLAAPFVLMGAALAVSVVALGALAVGAVLAIEKIVDFAPKLAKAGGDLVSGLIAGMEGKIADVAASAAKIAHSAIDAVRGVLKNHSPSQVMIDIGMNTAAGMAIGIERGSGEVADVSRQMGRSSMVAAGQSAGASRGEESRGSVVNHLTVQVQVQGDGKGASEMSEEILSLTFERLAGMQGLGSGA